MSDRYIFDTIDGEVLAIQRTDVDSPFEQFYDCYLGGEEGTYIGEAHGIDENDLKESVNFLL